MIEVALAMSVGPSRAAIVLEVVIARSFRPMAGRVDIAPDHLPNVGDGQPTMGQSVLISVNPGPNGWALQPLAAGDVPTRD